MLDFSELAPEGPRLLTRLEFEKLGQTDLFDDDERIELLRGVLVRMTPPVPSPRHDAAIHRLTRLQGALLLVEVAVTSLRKDRRIKTSIYAEGDVAEYWIVDVDGRAIEVHREAREGVFTDIRRYVDGEVTRPLRFPETTIAVNDVLAPPAR